MTESEARSRGSQGGPEAAPASPDRSGKKEALNPQNAALQMAVLFDGKIPQPDEITEEKVQAQAHKDGGPTSRIAKHSYNQRFDRWFDESFMEKPQDERERLYDSAMDTWRGKTTEFIEGCNDEQKEFLERMGMQNAQSILRTYFEEKEGDPKFFAQQVAANFSRDEISKNIDFIKTVGKLYGPDSKEIVGLLSQAIKNAEAETVGDFVKTAKDSINRSPEFPGKTLVTNIDQSSNQWDHRKQKLAEKQRQEQEAKKRQENEDKHGEDDSDEREKELLEQINEAKQAAITPQKFKEINEQINQLTSLPQQTQETIQQINQLIQLSNKISIVTSSIDDFAIAADILGIEPDSIQRKAVELRTNKIIEQGLQPNIKIFVLKESEDDNAANVYKFNVIPVPSEDKPVQAVRALYAKALNEVSEEEHTLLLAADIESSVLVDNNPSQIGFDQPDSIQGILKQLKFPEDKIQTTIEELNTDQETVEAKGDTIAQFTLQFFKNDQTGELDYKRSYSVEPK